MALATGTFLLRAGDGQGDAGGLVGAFAADDGDGFGVYFFGGNGGVAAADGASAAVAGEVVAGAVGGALGE